MLGHLKRSRKKLIFRYAYLFITPYLQHPFDPPLPSYSRSQYINAPSCSEIQLPIQFLLRYVQPLTILQKEHSPKPLRMQTGSPKKSIIPLTVAANVQGMGDIDSTAPADLIGSPGMRVEGIAITSGIKGTFLALYVLQHGINYD